MLIAQGAKQGVLRLPRAAANPSIHPSGRSSTFARASPQQPLRVPSRYYYPSRMMLGQAVKKYERKQALHLPPQSSFGSSPAEQAPKSSSVTIFVIPGYRNPLNPANPSRMNGLSKPQHSSRASVGVKRTASGLAKAIDGSFDDRPGSQNHPILLNDHSPSRKFVEAGLFDEDDFDSEVDLDTEEPLPKSTVSYPQLPKDTSKGLPAKSSRYPSLPKPHPTQSASAREFSTVPDSRQMPSHMSPVSQAPDSSAPLPWSSSPLDHHSSAMPPPPLNHFAYEAAGRARSTAQQNVSPQPKPAKRRTLPWLEETSQEPDDDSTAPVEPKAAPSLPKPRSTPLSKTSKSSGHPWNTTASALKQQQRKHREEVKKSSAKHEDHDEAVGHAKKSTQKRPAKVFLSEEQQHVLDLVMNKKCSVFFTGSAGTGKSVLMREIISSLRKHYMREPDRVAVTASTGLAACNIGGVTLHSFAGIGLGKEDVPELVRKIKRNQKAKHRWMRTKILILDEVSMVDGDLFDKLEGIARSIRGNARPFGGIQLVITGDFFQLPPVPDNNRIARFAFDAGTWKTSIEHTIGLHHVFRQKDPIFAGMLNEMREGRLSQSSINAFRNLSRPLTFEDTLDATELFPTRAEVEKANSDRLRMLQGDLVSFPARDGGSITDKTQRDKLLSNSMAPEVISLKKGAQVMLIKNIDEQLVNGSIGRVIGFLNEREFDSYSISEEGKIPQSPGGTIKGSNPSMGHEDIRARLMDSVSTSQRWPLVRFLNADNTWRDLLCQPESWKVELPNGEVQASRSQIPLILAWALSIHKAQGQTLERVKVDLGKVFEKGQAYVALSRATSMAGLQVLRFDPKKVVAHDKVRTFYSNLSRVELAEKNKDRMDTMKKSVTANDYESNFVAGDFEEEW